MPNFIDITGQRFGRLVAIRPTDQRKGGQVLWECKCDCGNIVKTVQTSLKAGTTKSCGCLQRDVTAQMGRNRAKDLTGLRFGRLVVTRLTDKRKGGRFVWECKCDCGNVIEAHSPSLLSGDRKSCGCLAKEACLRLEKNNTIDITGQRFGMLVAIRPTGKKKKGSTSSPAIWECRCDCGNIIEVQKKNLLRGSKKSCGCLFHEMMVEHGKSIDVHKVFGLVENTSLSMLKDKKPRKDSKTGYRGVYFSNRDQKYIASIGFKKKDKKLGSFDTLEEAVKARAKAEKEIYEPFLKKYEENCLKDEKDKNK